MKGEGEACPVSILLRNLPQNLRLEPREPYAKAKLIPKEPEDGKTVFLGVFPVSNLHLCCLFKPLLVIIGGDKIYFASIFAYVNDFGWTFGTRAHTNLGTHSQPWRETNSPSPVLNAAGELSDEGKEL
ncbi:TPA_exp: Uncharacterized protein A8136_2295 [Trichophyton benhamiae CBS 112371]|nr:TPA_exp: Uncharacterized protein A8136_2295 [Trichophyton benhamiae CBS 112371]